MSIDQGKYICACTDFGFKRLFGSELNKDILISFLNSFLNLKDKIVDLCLGLSIKSVYTIGILNFVLEKDSEPYRHEVVLYDKVTNCQFNAKWLTIILNYLNLPKQKMNLKLSKINGCMQ